MPAGSSRPWRPRRRISDDIAYTAHDLEDGLSSGLIGLPDLRESPLVRRHWPGTAEWGTGYDRVAVRILLSGIIGELAEGLIRATGREIRDSGADLEGPDAPLRMPRALVKLPRDLRSELRQLKTTLFRKLYRHPKVRSAASGGTRLLPHLFHHFRDHPGQLPGHFRRRIGDSSRDRVVCDYIAGMTDRFARDEHRRLFG